MEQQVGKNSRKGRFITATTICFEKGEGPKLEKDGGIVGLNENWSASWIIYHYRF